jgi:hypothetical protein
MIDNDTLQKRRFGTLNRSVVIAAGVAAFSWYFKQPSAPLPQMFLVAAGLQGLVLLIRRFVPADFQPQVMDIFELIVDGATVLSFALGVFGGILRMPPEL